MPVTITDGGKERVKKKGKKEKKDEGDACIDHGGDI